MSTPIWDTGDVLASLCVTDCDRCEEHGRCVQIFIALPPPHRRHINLCLACFDGLAQGVAAKRSGP